MSLLGERLVTRRRYASGSYVTGVYAPGAPTDSAIRATVQPLDGDDLQGLDEGDRTRRTRKIYTEADVRTVAQTSTNPPTNLVADEVVIDGVVFEVRRVETQPAILPHRKAILVALREPG